MDRTELDDLFHQTLDVVNRALRENRDHPLHGRVIDLFDDQLEGHKAHVLVYEDDPAAKLASYTVVWHHGSWELLTRGKGPYDSEWPMSREYLDEVAGDPESFVENPARLDWRWLAHRIPDGLRQVTRWGTRAPT